MPSPPTATTRARPPALPVAGRLSSAVSVVLLACAGCHIDDRTFENGTLVSSQVGADGGLPGPTDAGPGDAGGRDDAAPLPPDSSESIAERPIRALGDASATALMGAETGRDERARCVEGVLVGLDYRFNDSTHESFPNRFTFVAPVCATPNVSARSLELSEPASVAWSVVGGDAAEVVRPVPTHQLRCPEGYAIVGLTGSMDEVQTSPQVFAVRELEMDCAPLLVDAGRVDIARGPIASVAAKAVSPAPGALHVEVACEVGTTVATGALVSWGSWLDGVGLQCSRLGWPFTGGHGCALDEDCQSGVCQAFATCAP
jgi:hypothetical protein